MVDFKQIIEDCAYSKIEQKALLFAKGFSESKFSDVSRLSGDSLYDHNLRAATSLLEIKAASDVVIAALLHGSLKHVTERELFEEFGKEILDLIKGAESIKSVKQRNKKLQSDSLRKVLLTTLKDPRILFVKFAIKLDNLRHISVLIESEQKRIAQEVLDVYAPLAYRLGVEKLRVQLEDEAFLILHPNKYLQIDEYLKKSGKTRQAVITELMTEISSNCPVKIARIKGRKKHLYSIYKKMKERGVSLDNQYDHLAIRIVVSNEEECYIVLGFLHEKYEPISGRLKDYITNPRPNGYQSIHTGILLGGRKVEVQIRTEKMDEIAEEGVAAHWMYKGVKGDLLFQKRMGWLKGILDLQKDADSKEFLENVKVDLFTDEIYVYTPKGDVRYLAKGSFVLDFAYSVHEQVGNTSVGARVNGKFLSLRTKLSQGDIIEIVTSKNQRPRQSWLKIVQSSKAKQKIRKAIKEHEDVPLLHYRQFTKSVSEEHDTLAIAPDHVHALCILAKCCLPIPGNDVVGISTKRRLISVHKEECKHSLKMKDRWIPVQWKETFNKPLQLHVHAGERSGLLADLLNTIARARFIVKEAKAKFIGTGTTECSFVVVPRELKELERLLEIIFKVKGVKKIYFG